MQEIASSRVEPAGQAVISFGKEFNGLDIPNILRACRGQHSAWGEEMGLN